VGRFIGFNAFNALTACSAEPLSPTQRAYGDLVENVPSSSSIKMLTLNRSLRTGVAALSLSLLASTSAFAGGTTMPSKDIVDTAVSAGSFKTLTAALKAAGLVETLKGKGPFSVFAPNDEAFAKLPEGTVKSLLKPENKQKLTAILTYHVVAGNVKAADVIKLSSVKTLNGQSVMIKIVGGKVLINGSTVVKADIAATNGTIHVIDTVLMPK
jgi:uncharacterized surface protein with fasciclin (FAS1) repeats